MDCSPPGSSVHGILQARTLEWVAIPFSRGSFRPRGQTHVFLAGGFFTTEPPGKPPNTVVTAAYRVLNMCEASTWLTLPAQLHCVCVLMPSPRHGTRGCPGSALARAEGAPPHSALTAPGPCPAPSLRNSSRNTVVSSLHTLRHSHWFEQRRWAASNVDLNGVNPCGRPSFPFPFNSFAKVTHTIRKNKIVTKEP